MGIKGIYREIGPGDRISLCKLAVDTLEQTGRPLRLAIDFSIWQFQVQAARGGANPAIRTLFYRLVRLLGLAVHPIFVFDGPNKPAFKRNKRSGRGDGVATIMAKRLIRLFGFAVHDAPGEAEAECALLERQGIVDAVLSEDVDTIMFGCRRTLRNWSAEGTKGSRAPTHVSMYDAAAVAAGPSGLDREGMVLVALMSGGDYLPEGVPGCGVKVACEAARAGFGRDLCRIKRADRAGLAAWKERLLHELRTNESGFFRTRHKSLEIPDGFPNMEVLRYYTHPVVSREATVERLRGGFPPASSVDIAGLRDFARETFDWAFRIGAVKLVRVLAPSLLVQRLLERSTSGQSRRDDPDLNRRQECALIKSILGKRAHFSTDTTPELRISFIPADIVKLDLDAEPEEEVEAFGRSGIALNSDDEFEEEAAEELGGDQPTSSAHKKTFDPSQPELAWIPTTVARLGIPLTVADWEGKQQLKEQKAATKTTKKTRGKKTDMPFGALDRYVKVSKSTADTLPKDVLSATPPPPGATSQCCPPATRGRSKQSRKTCPAPVAAGPAADVNPWTLASSQVSPRATTKSLASSPVASARPRLSWPPEPIVLSSSPVAASPPPAPSAGMTRGPSTPTRTKRLPSPPVENGPSPAPLFSPSPVSISQPSAQREPAAQDPAAAETQETRKARPFKRVKSGADNISRISTSAQLSIKAFGRLTKDVSGSCGNAKAPVSDHQPIEILSDDEDIPLPPMKQPVFGSKRSEIFSGSQAPAHSHSPTISFAILDDDDPFASPRSVPRRTASPTHPAPLSFAAEVASRIDTRSPGLDASPGLGDGYCGDKLNCGTEAAASATPADGISEPAPGSVTASTSSPASASAAAGGGGTTKVYIPRTSLDGLGYFREIEVARDEADGVLAAHNQGLSEHGAKRAGRRAWRLSEINVLDLTGED